MTWDFQARLRKREPLIGTLLSLPSPELAEIASEAGFDWLFLDMEHGNLDATVVLRMIQAVKRSCACVVRIPKNETIWTTKALDSGADGLIIPHVNSAGEAAEAVRNSKYPPEGNRSVGFSRASGYGRRFQDEVQKANRRTAIIVQIEHIAGVGHIDAILDVKGVDAAFIGPYDLSASLNMPGRIQDQDVQKAMERVKEACSRRGLPAGIYAGDISSARKAFDDGYSFVCSGIDITLYAGAVDRIIKEIRPS